LFGVCESSGVLVDGCFERGLSLIYSSLSFADPGGLLGGVRSRLSSGDWEVFVEGLLKDLDIVIALDIVIKSLALFSTSSKPTQIAQSSSLICGGYFIFWRVLGL